MTLRAAATYRRPASLMRWRVGIYLRQTPEEQVFGNKQTVCLSVPFFCVLFCAHIILFSCVSPEDYGISEFPMLCATTLTYEAFLDSPRHGIKLKKGSRSPYAYDQPRFTRRG